MRAVAAATKSSTKDCSESKRSASHAFGCRHAGDDTALYFYKMAPFSVKGTRGLLFLTTACESNYLKKDLKKL